MFKWGDFTCTYGEFTPAYIDSSSITISQDSFNVTYEDSAEFKVGIVNAIF